MNVQSRPVDELLGADVAVMWKVAGVTACVVLEFTEFSERPLTCLTGERSLVSVSAYVTLQLGLKLELLVTDRTSKPPWIHAIVCVTSKKAFVCKTITVNILPHDDMI